MIHQLGRRIGIQLFLCEDIRISDIDRAIGDLLESFSGAAAIDRDDAVRIFLHKALCRGLCQRKQGRRTCCAVLDAVSAAAPVEAVCAAASVDAVCAAASVDAAAGAVLAAV